MPLVRLQVRNEYGLGNPELYRKAARRDDTMAVLDGVAVSGLVGILRQLGDLAGFASEIFHDLHEQIMSTSARGHRMMARVKSIEAVLPQIENAVETQNSHIQFAYLPGSNWHASIPIGHAHLVGGDLPQFIMDSYEECRDPPSLFLLDKFDGTGAGACLKRYSDPTYFRRVWNSSQIVKEDKHKKEKKAHRSKRNVQQMRNREVQCTTYLSHRNSSIRISSLGTDDQSIAADTISKCNMRLNSELGSPLASLDSRTRISGEEIVNATFAAGHGESISIEAQLLKSEMDCRNECDSQMPSKHYYDAHDDSVHDSLKEKNCPRPPITWDEKTEVLKPKCSDLCGKDIIDSVQKTGSSTMISDQLKIDGVRIKGEQLDKDRLSLPVTYTPHHENDLPDAGDPTTLAGSNHCDEITSTRDKCVDQGDLSFHATSSTFHDDMLYGDKNLSSSGALHFDEVTSETDNFVDAVNTLDSDTETDSEVETIREVNPTSICRKQTENRVGHIHELSLPKSDALEDGISTVTLKFLHKKISTEIDPKFPKDVGSQSLPVIGLNIGQNIPLNNDLGEVRRASHQTTANNGTSNEQSSRCNISDVQSHSSVSNNSKLQTAVEVDKVVEVYDIPGASANFDESVVKIWTNGGLLGLEPSKPPDFTKPTSLSQQSASSTSKDGCSSAPEMQEDGHSRHEEFLQPHKSIPKNPGSNLESNGLHKLSGLKDLCTNQLVGEKMEPVYIPHHSPSFNEHSNKFQNSLSTAILQREQNLAENEVDGRGHESLTDVSSNESGPDDTCNPSNIPILACKSSASTLQRETSLNLVNHATRRHSSTLETTDSMISKERSITNDCRKGHHNVVTQGYHKLDAKEKHDQGILEDKISCNLQVSGPPSPHSPPLEHMKVSFQPMDRSVTSKLKLEFPDGHLHDSIEDLMFPSFQLLPVSTGSVHHLNSDSDDDTFCRSSSSYSENVPDHHSDSDSELWESKVHAVGGNQDILDVSHTVSSTSVSALLDSDRVNHHSLHSEAEYGNSMSMENGIMIFQSGDIMDLPSLESLNSSIIKQELSPPLPPVHWRTMKSSLPCLNGHVSRSEAANISAGMKDHESFRQQPEHAECKSTQPLQPSLPADIGRKTLRSTKSMESQKNNEVNQVVNSKEDDESGKFLHQIRSKSFNLRRTITTQQSFAPGPTTNVKVAAILEKANAIRQAVVSSDDGGDDNWSDS